MLSDPAHPLPTARRVRAQMITFDSDAGPILKGQAAVFHLQSTEVECVVARLIALMDRATGEVRRKRPRMLQPNETAVVELGFQRGVNVEKYSDYKQLGRFMLRKKGKTIAAGIILDVLD